MNFEEFHNSSRRIYLRQKKWTTSFIVYLRDEREARRRLDAPRCRCYITLLCKIIVRSITNQIVSNLNQTDTTICRKKRSLKHSLPAPMKGGRGANRAHFLLTEFALKVERSSHIISVVISTVNTITVGLIWL